jgi:tRNA (guanine37-N1)-methyltransferase
MSFRATVLTLFPEMFPGPLGLSLAGRALEGGLWSLEAKALRDFGIGRHRAVDDTPFGGGAGMVMRPDVLDAAIRSARDERDFVVFTPRGAKLTQDRVRRLAGSPGVVLLCGRFEGIDQRVLDAHQAEELSIGDYVLSGGEIAAFALLDAVIRLIPGVMGTAESGIEESFAASLLEYPHYTRPAIWQDRPVPEILLSGHHEAIAAWRRSQSEAITRSRRPDLWSRHIASNAAAS